MLQKVGLNNIVVVSLLEKILALDGRPLLVDTGDPEIDRALSKHIKVVTGYGDQIIYPVTSGIPNDIHTK